MSCSMKCMMATMKTTQINRATTAPRLRLEHYRRDINSWPTRGGGWRSAAWREACKVDPPFLEHLAASNLSPKTIQKHIDKMWLPGGEFVRDLHNDPSLRKRPWIRILFKMIEYGEPAPLSRLRRSTRIFESTCKKLRRFLLEAAR